MAAFTKMRGTPTLRGLFACFAVNFGIFYLFMCASEFSVKYLRLVASFNRISKRKCEEIKMLHRLSLKLLR